METGSSEHWSLSPHIFDKCHFRHRNLQPVNQEGWRRRNKNISRCFVLYIFVLHGENSYYNFDSYYKVLMRIIMDNCEIWNPLLRFQWDVETVDCIYLLVIGMRRSIIAWYENIKHHTTHHHIGYFYQRTTHSASQFSISFYISWFYHCIVLTVFETFKKSNTYNNKHLSLQHIIRGKLNFKQLNFWRFPV